MNNFTYSENPTIIMDDDGDDKDDSKRRTRNLSEKKRRDQFNMLVNELSALISPNNKKMDKSSVLKSTISFLRNHNEVTVRSKVHEIQPESKPTFLSNEEFTYLVLEALEAFIMVLSTAGQICYVSESIHTLLGHNIGHILNQSIFNLMFEDDKAQLYRILQDPTTSGNSNVNGNEITFRCHLKRGSSDFNAEELYECVQFSGFFRRTAESSNAENDEDTRILFICTGHLCTPQLIRDVSLVDTNRSEFTSRHSLENFHFLFLDHRAPPIIGYLPLEVLGTSGFDYYHFDDLEKVVTCHEALMQKGELTSCYYRFLTKGQQWIWLQTRFYITYHQWNSKPEFVVCTNRVVSYSDVHRNVRGNSIERTSPCEEVLVHESEDQRPEETLTTAQSFIADASEQMGSTYQPSPRPQSVKSASGGSTIGTSATVGTTAASVWPRPSYDGSDTTSVSGYSKSSQRRHSRETHKEETVHHVTAFMSHHGMAVQYLNAPPYISAVPIQGVHIPLHVQPLPLLVSPQQSDLQLQRKHEELQEMIVRQQEELRRVKEQLFLARLGMLPPVINMPNQYVNVEELTQQDQQQINHVPQAIVYTPSEDIPGYPSHQAQHPPQTPQ